MFKQFLLLSALFMSGAVHAVTGGMTLLPTAATDGKNYQAKFAIGLTVDGGKSWQTSAYLNQTITFQASIDPDPAHVGKTGDVFVVEYYNGKLMMLNASKVWVPWDGKITSLQPFLDEVMLSANQAITIYQGGISTEGEHQLYLGYLPSVSAAPLIYSASQASFKFTAAQVDTYTFFQDQVFNNIIVGNLCITCHNDKGAASTSKLRFINDVTKVKENFDIFSAFYKQQSDAYNYVLGKVSGNNHTGGNRLPLGSSEYQTMAGFLDLLDGATRIPSTSAVNLFDGVSILSPVDTLHNASLLFAGRLPTSAEISLVSKGGDASLKQTLMALMKGYSFHKFLKDAADDRLFLRGNEDNQLLDDCNYCFPAMNSQYWLLKDKADLSTAIAADKSALSLWAAQINYSLKESPLELIAYVVEHDQPYSDILTANYEMLTPVLNPLVGGTAKFDSGASNTDFAPGQITDYHMRDSATVLQAVSGSLLPRITTAPKLVTTFPHVGVLSSKSFLSRYPTTATNRNRARARWTYYNFLGIDIEALAKRTTDPVALADTNNPTMNNPACAVCHSVLDPVAGIFQDFADNGIYKSALNGTDSLDSIYKSARNPRQYVNGDTWYRDMRIPGFEGAGAPTGNMLRWLAQLIVKDNRFATATVRFWWPAVIGSEILKLPEATSDANYQTKLTAYQSQQDEINALSAKFVQSGLSLKSLLADLVLSKWNRADMLTSAVQVSSIVSGARSQALVSADKLLTPEQLAVKTKALTGFNWNAKADTTTGEQVGGLEGDFNTFYGGIDGFALKVRARALSPMMNSVAATHALEASCPIVLGDFIRPDTQRLLFGGLSPWTTPLTEQSITQQISSTSEGDFKNSSFTVTLAPGTHQLVVSMLNDACDFSTSASTCKADKNLVINNLTIQKPNGQSTTFNGNLASFGSCAAITNSTRLTLYASCTATYNFFADQQGSYTITASLAAKQQSADPVLAGLNVEAADPVASANTAGATLIKQKLVELHSKLLGQTVTVASPEVQASYDLLVQTWTGRKAANISPALFNKTYACDWSTDIGFIATLGYVGNPLQANGNYNTTAVTNWLAPQAQDPLYMKQSWAVVMVYMLSHYDFLDK